jgi:pimeloyl-ACP methyl ester carboxylesterase
MAQASLDGFSAGYIEVAGLRVWREMAGAGPTVVLLHGAFSGASAWAAQAPTLVKAGFAVHVPERRGHAHTADVEGPLTYSTMADDTIAYLDQEVHTPAHLIGWSDGAVVALLVALRRPELVGRLVLIGQYYNSSGKMPVSGMLDMMESPEGMGFLRAEYDRLSPDGPEHFAIVHAKTVAMIKSEPELDLADLAAFDGETIVLQGDRDEVTVEHSAAVAAALGNGRLAVLPGTHGLPLEQPGPVNALLASFLWRGFPRGFFEAS